MLEIKMCKKMIDGLYVCILIFLYVKIFKIIKDTILYFYINYYINWYVTKCEL